jgi:transcriptional regulator MraZ
MGLTGVTKKQIDSKGRLNVPKKLRMLFDGQSSSGVTILKIDGCLQIYPQVMWAKLQESIENLSPFAERTRKLQRFWGMRSDQVTIDSEGRISLTKDQKDYAGIDRDVVIVGAINKVEIWSPETWIKAAGDAPALEELADEMSQEI